MGMEIRMRGYWTRIETIDGKKKLKNRRKKINLFSLKNKEKFISSRNKIINLVILKLFKFIK